MIQPYSVDKTHTLVLNEKNNFKVKGWKKRFHADDNKKRPRVIIQISN